jgi:hypothetical protein
MEKNYTPSNKKNIKSPQINKKIFQVHKILINKLKAKYYMSHTAYSQKIINDIIYNEKSNIVAKFKDFLIFDDLSEFMKRYYKLSETYTRLPKIYDYYENYSKIFPNYTNLPEAKYVYKNIQKKQKMIDNQQQIEIEKHEKKEEKYYKIEKGKPALENNIFNTEIMESIMNQTDNTHVDFKITTNIEQTEKDVSVISINKLIDQINIAEMQKTSPLVIFSDPITSRVKLNSNLKCLSPINNSSSKEKMSTALRESKFKKNISPKAIFASNSSNLQQSQPTKSSIKTIESKTEKQIESDLIQKKLNFKQKNKINSEATSLINLKEKIKAEYNNTVQSQVNNTGINSVKTEKAKSKYQNIQTETREEKLKSSIFMRESKNSVPKMTNNIYYIINQNPQINTQITIYGNVNSDLNIPNIISNNNSRVINELKNASQINIIASPGKHEREISLKERNLINKHSSLSTKLMFLSEKNNNKKVPKVRPELMRILNQKDSKVADRASKFNIDFSKLNSRKGSVVNSKPNTPCFTARHVIFIL